MSVRPWITVLPHRQGRFRFGSEENPLAKRWVLHSSLVGVTLPPMVPDVTPDLVREYLRVSIDRSGRERSPEEQHADNKRVAQTRGWTLGEAYRDIGSASRYARKGREGFERLLADLDADTFGAQILMLWESSRGSRKVSEWLSLIELCEDRGVQIHVTSDSKTYDPANPRDRRSLLEDAIDSEYESAKVSKRTKRNTASLAAEGRPHGKIPFGYQRVYSDKTGRLEQQIPNPEEAEIIRRLFDQLYKGVSLNAIERDFAARGFLRRQRHDKEGKPLPRTPFSAEHLRDLALTRTYIGERVHDPKRRSGHLSPAAKMSKGIWPALVSRKKFLAVERMLNAPERKTTRGGRAVHLLSLIAKCDVCEGWLNTRSHPRKAGEQVYCCRDKGHVTVPYDDLNAVAEEQIIEYLTSADNLIKLTQTDDDELEHARTMVAEIEGELRSLALRVGRGELSVDLATLAEPGIQTRLKEARSREARLSTPAELAGYLEPGEDVRMAWRRMPVAAKRVVARKLFSSKYLGELRVIRGPGRGVVVPVQSRVVWQKDG